jgi:hypothetical protein
MAKRSTIKAKSATGSVFEKPSTSQPSLTESGRSVSDDDDDDDDCPSIQRFCEFWQFPCVHDTCYEEIKGGQEHIKKQEEESLIQYNWRLDCPSRCRAWWQFPSLSTAHVYESVRSPESLQRSLRRRKKNLRRQAQKQRALEGLMDANESMSTIVLRLRQQCQQLQRKVAELESTCGDQQSEIDISTPRTRQESAGTSADGESRRSVFDPGLVSPVTNSAGSLRQDGEPWKCPLKQSVVKTTPDPSYEMLPKQAHSDEDWCSRCGRQFNRPKYV